MLSWSSARYPGIVTAFPMNKLRAGLPTVAKKLVWNMKYGLLGYPRFEAPEDAVHYLSVLLGQAGELLELGWDLGSLVRALRQTGWKGHYCGVDISARQSRKRAQMWGQRSSWVVSDFESFQSPFQWNTIAMIESIYYVSLDRVPACLKPAGRYSCGGRDPASSSARCRRTS